MVKKFQYWSKILNAIVFILGCKVLVGWALNIRLIQNPKWNYVLMNPLTAIAFIIATISLFCSTAKRTSPYKSLIGKLCALMVLFIGTIVLAAAALNFNLHVNQLFKESNSKHIIAGEFSAMAVNTSICFMLLGCALWFLHHGNERTKNIGHILTIIAAFLGLFSLIAYFYELNLHIGSLNMQMSVSTSFAFLVFPLSILFAFPQTEIMRILCSKLGGSVTARKLLPFAFLVPTILGFLGVYSTNAKVVSGELAATLVIVGIIVISFIYILLHAAALNLKDIERLKAQQKLRQNEQFLRTVLNTIGDGVIVIDKDGNHLMSNPAAREKLGFIKPAYKDQNREADYGIYHPDGVKLFDKDESPLALALNGISSEGLELLIRNEYNPAGSLVSVTANPLKGENDTVIGAVAVSHDVTLQKRADSQLKDLNQELEAFTYSVSHDLRAPLRIINGYAELIGKENSDLPDEVRRMVGNIIINSRRMGQLIDDLLNFSRLGRRELIKHNTDMKQLVEDIVKEQIPGYNNNPQVLIYDLPTALCDSNLIRQVWQNLIINAIKYSSKTSSPKVEIGCNIEDRRHVYFVRDNGVGFDMKYYDKLFGVFQRLHNSSEFEGTGVGLALAKRIITKHGGSIWAESKLNEGSTFYFTTN